jgi:uncharacterized protein
MNYPTKLFSGNSWHFMKRSCVPFSLTICTAALLLLCLSAFGQVKGIPEKPNPPRLVNDFGLMLNREEQSQLEAKLLDFEQTTSTQITIVTIESLGDYDVSDFAIKLGQKWGVGKDGKNNGVVILASRNDHKLFIATGKGVEGALTDYIAGKIRDKMKPYFKQGKYFEGFSVAADNVIAATKGEFKADPKDAKKKKGPSVVLIIIIIIVLIIVVGRNNRNNRGGGGRYISGGGVGDIMTGMLLGNMLGGGRGGGFGGGGGDSGGFGGFGGGDFGGGGAGGSWD